MKTISQKDLKVIGLSCLNLNLRRTSRLITTFYDSILRPCGLRITQFTVLVSIAFEKEPSITDLARLTDIDRTTLQRSLEILSRDGLINIEKKEIGNVRSISLTKKGLSILTEGIELWRQAQESVTDSIGKSKFKETLKILSELRSLPLLKKSLEE